MNRPVDPLTVEAQVCLALSAAARSLVAFYRPLLDPLGLTHPQYMAMLALWEHGRLSLKDLAGMLHLDPGTLSPLVKRLETMGLVTRERDPDDERVLAIDLTDAGRRLRASAEAVPLAMVEGLGLAEDQLTRIREAADLVIAACAAATERGADVAAGQKVAAAAR